MGAGALSSLRYGGSRIALPVCATEALASQCEEEDVRETGNRRHRDPVFGGRPGIGGPGEGRFSGQRDDGVHAVRDCLAAARATTAARLDHCHGELLDALRRELVGPSPAGEEVDISRSIILDDPKLQNRSYRQVGTGEEILTRDPPIKRYG